MAKRFCVYVNSEKIKLVLLGLIALATVGTALLSNSDGTIVAYMNAYMGNLTILV